VKQTSSYDVLHLSSWPALRRQLLFRLPRLIILVGGQDGNDFASDAGQRSACAKYICVTREPQGGLLDFDNSRAKRHDVQQFVAVEVTEDAPEVITRGQTRFATRFSVCHRFLLRAIAPAGSRR
jgi:hypothetical protein